MDIFKVSERAMAMDDATWARHANPLSAYSRMISGVGIFFAFWSPYWIGCISILPIAATAGWIFLNPRLFPPPQHTKAWATKAVLGERVFIRRKERPIPVGFERAGYISTGFSVAFFAITVLGFVQKNFWAAFAGWHGAVLAKLWFVDRMALLWDAMKDEDPLYQAWDRADWSVDARSAPASAPTSADQPTRSDH